MKCVVVLVVVGLTASAMGDVVGNPYDGTTSRSIAQDWVHPAFPANNVWVISDFETTVDYYLSDVSAHGETTHAGGADGTGANFDVWDGLPWDGGSVVLSATNGWDHLGSEGLLGADFGGQILPAGDYYMVFQGVRNFMGGGMSLVLHTWTGNEDDYHWNPDEGLGWGPHQQVQDSEGVFFDVNWQLNALPVPEPTSLLLLAIGAGALLRRR